MREHEVVQAERATAESSAEYLQEDGRYFAAELAAALGPIGVEHLVRWDTRVGDALRARDEPYDQIGDRVLRLRSQTYAYTTEERKYLLIRN